MRPPEPQKPKKRYNALGILEDVEPEEAPTNGHEPTGTDTAVDIGPDTKSIPVKRVSKDCGDYLHWSGDASRLYWSLGPDLFSRDLKDVFAFMAGALEKLPEPPTTGTNIAFSQPYDIPAGKLAVADVPLSSREQVDELERAGVDAVIVGARDVAELVGDGPPQV